MNYLSEAELLSSRFSYLHTLSYSYKFHESLTGYLVPNCQLSSIFLLYRRLHLQCLQFRLPLILSTIHVSVRIVGKKGKLFSTGKECTTKAYRFCAFYKEFVPCVKLQVKKVLIYRVIIVIHRNIYLLFSMLIRMKIDNMSFEYHCSVLHL
jgi:hypothetical protein